MQPFIIWKSITLAADIYVCTIEPNSKCVKYLSFIEAVRETQNQRKVGGTSSVFEECIYKSKNERYKSLRNKVERELGSPVKSFDVL
jgi:hypothetical protein